MEAWFRCRYFSQSELVYWIQAILLENSPQATKRSTALQSILGCDTRLIAIKSGGDSRFAFLEVSDAGCGISTKNLARISSPIFSTKESFHLPAQSFRPTVRSYLRPPQGHPFRCPGNYRVIPTTTRVDLPITGPFRLSWRTEKCRLAILIYMGVWFKLGL